MSEIVCGTPVWAKDAFGKQLRKVAISPCVRGRDFPVVWVVWPEEFDPDRAPAWEALAHQAAYARIDGMPGAPWPCEDVTIRSEPENSQESSS